jgi:glycosyltransferase involved in cell wall biosynthesis
LFGRRSVLLKIFPAEEQRPDVILDAMTVRFSVLIPVYNRENYVRAAVDSVLNQTFSDFELLAVDDGSTARSAVVLESYGNKLRLIQQRN